MQTEKAEDLSWDQVRATFDQAVPGWNHGAVTATVGQACEVLERLVSSADELVDLQYQLRQEMSTIRHVLTMEGLPGAAQKELQAHLIRLARLI